MVDWVEWAEDCEEIGMSTGPTIHGDPSKRALHREPSSAERRTTEQKGNRDSLPTINKK